MSQRKKYAVIGAGGRAMAYIDAMCGVHREQTDLVALCDPSPSRMAWHNQRIAEKFSARPLATYTPDQFDLMIREQKPASAIVCTPDYLHHEYVIRALEGGCDAICEKPMTIDAPKCERSSMRSSVPAGSFASPSTPAICRKGWR